MFTDDVSPCCSCHLKSAVGSSVQFEHSAPCSKLQSNGDCGARVVRWVVVVGGGVVDSVGILSFIGRLEQLLVVNVKSSIAMSP